MPRPMKDVLKEILPASCFRKNKEPPVNLKFWSRDDPDTGKSQALRLSCEKDFGACNRQCEKIYHYREEQFEQPCKMRVADFFLTDSWTCFPAIALLQEKTRGRVRMSDLEVGDEVESDSCFSKVVAMLHVSPQAIALYLLVQHTGGELAISPQHLLRAKGSCEETASWIPAENIRPGDELVDDKGSCTTVQHVRRACLRGAYAPLTASGCLVVDGILCSCFAPPAAWKVPHEACQAVMLPLRLLDWAKRSTERLTQVSGKKEPLLTIDALWLLPLGPDGSMHPYCSGLLRLAASLLRLGEAAKFHTESVDQYL